MQVYRGMDIGTAKATVEMQRELRHHLLDLVDPHEDLPVALFQRYGHEALDDIAQRGAVAVICGGSGLHFRSLVDPLEFPPSNAVVRSTIDALDQADARSRLEAIDPEVARHVDLANPRRVARALEIAEITGLTPSDRAKTEKAEAVRSYEPARDVVILGVDPGEELANRIERRFDEMLQRGLLDEVAGLQGRLGRLSGQAVGYKEMLTVAVGQKPLAEGRRDAIAATKALAKRQRTFFRRDPRVKWITWEPDPQKRLQEALRLLDGIV